MGVRENQVEKHLDERVVEINGLTRKWVSPGRDGVPDRIVIVEGAVIFVEVKTVDGVVTDTQLREHDRLWSKGAKVTTVYGISGVENLINAITEGVMIKRDYR
jgi:hypothetical protein